MMPCMLKVDGAYHAPKRFCEELASAILSRLSEETGISRIHFVYEAHLGGLEKADIPKGKRVADSLPDTFSADVEIEEMNGHPYLMHGWVADVSIVRSGPGRNDKEELTQGRIFFCPRE